MDSTQQMEADALLPVNYKEYTGPALLQPLNIHYIMTSWVFLMTTEFFFHICKLACSSEGHPHPLMNEATDAKIIKPVNMTNISYSITQQSVFQRTLSPY